MINTLPKDEVKVRIIGNPRILVDTVVKSLKEDFDKRIAEAEEAAYKLLEKSFDEALRVARESVRRAIVEARDRIESFKASKDVEARKELTRMKLKIMETILNEALQKLRPSIPEDLYRKFLEKLYTEAITRLSRHTTRIRIIPAENDTNILREIIATKTPAEIEVTIDERALKGTIGGFIAQSEDAKLSLDYRLETILSQAIDQARLVVLKTLFQEE